MAADDQFRVLAIGAHPDDADLTAGCLCARLVDKGARVRFVSVANGNRGHQSMAPGALAARRFLETQASARTIGVESYEVLGVDDCEVEPTLELRRTITRLIRTFAPHVVLTHRTCDYHADHRAVGTVVMDATYLLGVPHWCPDVPRPSVLPAVFFMSDEFTVPRPLLPDLLIDGDPYIERVADAALCHESQVFEWLPFDGGFADEVPDRSDVAACRAFVTRHWLAQKAADATRFAAAWRERNPDREVPAFVEAFELSEYGRKPTDIELDWLS